MLACTEENNQLINKNRNCHEAILTLGFYKPLPFKPSLTRMFVRLSWKAESKAIHSTIKLSKVKIVTIIKTTSNIFFSFYTCCSAELNSIPSIGSGSLASTLSVKPTWFFSDLLQFWGSMWQAMVHMVFTYFGCSGLPTLSITVPPPNNTITSFIESDRNCF
jgi:hypothetical protein